jgi:hypothetical protein
MLPKRRRYAEHRYDYVNGPYYSPRPRKNGPIVRIVPSGLSHRQIGPSVQIGLRGSRVPTEAPSYFCTCRSYRHEISYRCKTRRVITPLQLRSLGEFQQKSSSCVCVSQRFRFRRTEVEKKKSPPYKPRTGPDSKCETTGDPSRGNCFSIADFQR